MTVRAKMRCTRLSEYTNGDEVVQGVEVHLQPVYSKGEDDKPNAQWSKWTPSGEVRLQITNPEAFKQFKVGAAYFVDFSPAE